MMEPSVTYVKVNIGGGAAVVAGFIPEFSDPTVRTQIVKIGGEDGHTNIIDNNVVQVEDGTVTFHPNKMSLNQYYLAVLDGEPYLYKRVSDEEVEVYGLA